MSGRIAAVPRGRWHCRGFPLLAVLALALALGLALVVAFVIRRPPPDFSRLPVAATIPDAAGRALWVIRLNCPSHQIAIDAAAPPPAAHKRIFELWFVAPAPQGLRPLARMPLHGRRVVAVIPEYCQALAAGGTVAVTDQPAAGITIASPSGPALYRGSIASSPRNR